MTAATPGAGAGSALVLGAGIVGVASALALQREGFAVTLLDRGRPGEACSLGNAGHLGTASVLPQAAPGIARTVPRLLRDPQGPLAVQWGYVARNLPWFISFLRAGERRTAERTAEMVAVLLAEVGEAYAPLLRDACAADLVTPSGCCTCSARKPGCAAGAGGMSCGAASALPCRIWARRKPARGSRAWPARLPGACCCPTSPPCATRSS